jgi:hypothetical protein
MNRPTLHFRARLAVLVTGGALIAALFPMAGTALAAAPPAPSVPDLAAGSDTGSSNSDNITKTVNGLVFTGTAEVGSTVKIYLSGSTVIGSAVATGGAYSVTTTTAIPDNTANLITATATNGAAEESAQSGALTVTTDNTVPGAPSTPNLDPASDTGTSSTDDYTSDTTPTFSGTSDANATVQLFADAVSVGTAVASGTTWTITSSAVGLGVHLFTAAQTDAAGNGPSPVSAALSVTIDTAVPPAPSAPDLDPASDLGASNSDNITSDTTPTFNGTAAAGSTVALFAGTAQVGTVVAGGGGAWTITSSLLAAGTYAFTAKATNLAGPSVASPALSVSILTGLAVTVNQATGQADPTATTPINFTVVFSSAVTNFVTGDVTIGGTAGGVKVATITGTGTTYNVAVTGMTTAGTVVATVAAAVATDLAGNSNTASTSSDNSVSWDPTAGPTVTINQAAGQADPAGVSPINFTVIFSASVTGFDGTDVTLAGTAGATTAVVTGGPSTYNVAVSGMTTAGTVVASIAADRALSTVGGHPSRASTSTDNTVTFRLATKYLVTASTSTPLPGAAVTITAQLADAAGTAVPSSGVVVTWSKSGTGGSFSAATSTTNASGIATITFTVAATNGTIHTVTATSPGGITGTSTNITTSAPPAVISLTRSRGMITYGESVSLFVQFGTNGANRPFVLEYTSVGVAWATIANLTTNASGSASFAYSPTRTGYVRARFAGTTDLGAATSGVYIVGVRQTVTLSPHRAGTAIIGKGRSITFSSTVRPLRPDLLPSRVTFRFYRSVGGTWVLRYERHVATDSLGVARTTFRFGVGGTWSVRAFADRTPYNSVSRFSTREVYRVL